MSVELRCPDCRAKLRLPESPDPGTEVECPECNAVFPAPDRETGEAPDSRRKKKTAKRPAEAEEAEAKPKEPSKPQEKGAPRKRKAKKKETNTTALILVISLAVLFLALVVSLLVWYFMRTPPSYEMMNYLPEDATEAVGLNLGHMAKYAEFIKTVEPTYKDMGFQKAIEASAEALSMKPSDLPDYMVEGWGKSGGALVIRTKKKFDEAGLKKLPGAQEGKGDGQTYYSIAPIPKLFGGTPLKVFAPTDRLIVFCEYRLPDAVFKKMLAGNKDGDTLPKRLGSLGKRTTRGTFWNLSVLDTSNRPKEPPKKEGGQDGGHFQTMAATTAAKARGMGFKASLGSRAVRFEVVLWFDDSEVASDLYRKFKENDIIKAQDDSSLEPPKWWKDFAQQQIGDRSVSAELMTQLSAKSSGDLFIISSECETKNLMKVLSSLVQKITGQQARMGGGMPGGGMPGMGGQGPNGAGPPKGGMPMGAGP
jgi:hypothetical protein